MKYIDQFAGTATGGLATATNGAQWVASSGGNTDWSEGGGYATVTPAVAGSTVRSQVLPCVNGDGDVYLDFMFDSEPAGGTSQQLARLYTRVQSGTALSDGYRFTITKVVAGTATLGFVRLNASATTSLGGGSVNIPGDVIAGSWYTLHVNMAGLFIGANVYPQFDTEPVGYQRSATDSGAGTWASGVAVGVAHQATTGNTNLSPLHLASLVGTVAGAVDLPPPPVVVVKWTTRPGSDHGGGFTHVGAVDSLNQGRMAAGGDTWGIHITSDGGNSWRKRMRGCSVTSQGSVGPDLPIRALCFSKRPSTNGRLYVGQGRIHANVAGTGFFGYLEKDETKSIHKASVVPGFATTYSASAGQPRPAGDLIVSEYDASSDTEYVYALTPLGLYRTLNNSTQTPGDNGTVLAFSTPTTGTGWRWLTQIDANNLYCVTWNVDMTTLASISVIVYRVTSSGATLKTATSGQITVTQLTGTPSHVNAIKIIGGNQYAAGIDGVYKITSSGATWTKISGTTFTGECMAIGGYADTIYAVNKVSSSNPTQTILRSTAGAASAGGDWKFLVASDGSNVKNQLWGDGTPWWLYGVAASPDKINANPHTGTGVPFVASNIEVDPFDRSKITTWMNGAWQSRDTGASWRPTMYGLNGGEKQAATSGQKVLRMDGAVGHVTAQDVDYVATVTTDRFRTATDNQSPGSFAGGSASLTRTAGGHTYTIGVAQPAKLLRDGNVISDTYFENACVDPFDMQVDVDNTIYVAQSGGGLLVVDPPSGTTSTAAVAAFGRTLAGATLSNTPDGRNRLERYGVASEINTGA